MRRSAMTVLLLAGAVLSVASAADDPRSWRREEKDEKDRVRVLYKYGDRYSSPADQAARKAAEAAQRWQQTDPDTCVVPVVARSPFGGGESAAAYWPTGLDPQLLREVGPALKRASVRFAFPELAEPASAPAVDETDPLTGDAPASAPASQPAEAWPALGWPTQTDYEFMLTVGLHHEAVPYEGNRRTADGQVVYSRDSRFGAWAILFHIPSGTAIWGTVSTAHVNHDTTPDPIPTAARFALARLDFTGIGQDNIPAQIARLRLADDLTPVDMAAMLVQTQRADAVEAVVKVATSPAAYKYTARVLRYFNEKGNALDYRLTTEQVTQARGVYAAQRVVLNVLLVEQLRAVRSIQACLPVAAVPQELNLELGPLAERLTGQLGPMSAEDEVILMGELTGNPNEGAFKRNLVAAVRALGKCRHFVEEAKIVARRFADRPPPRPDPRGRMQADPLREAGTAALKELGEFQLRQRAER